MEFIESTKVREEKLISLYYVNELRPDEIII